MHKKGSEIKGSLAKIKAFEFKNFLRCQRLRWPIERMSKEKSSNDNYENYVGRQEERKKDLRNDR